MKCKPTTYVRTINRYKIQGFREKRSLLIIIGESFMKEKAMELIYGEGIVILQVEDGIRNSRYKSMIESCSEITKDSSVTGL